MIEINISEQPDLEEYDPYYGTAYEVDSHIQLLEGATATEAVAAFARAMQIDGYFIESIGNALYNYAEFLSNEYGFELEDDGSSEIEIPQEEVPQEEVPQEEIPQEEMNNKYDDEFNIF